MEEMKKLLTEQNKAFDEFKKANDERLEAKADGNAISELEAKTEKANSEITRLGKELEDLAKKAARPGGPADETTKAAEEHKRAWEKWARKGDDVGLEELEKKAINVGTPADGGFALPIEQDQNVLRMLRDVSPMRRICRTITVGTPDYRKLVNLGGTSSGWVGETDSRPETATATFAQVSPFMGEVYANPAVTQQALDDLFFDVAGELAMDIVTEFAEQEGVGFVNGNGEKKPKGFLAYPKDVAPDKSRPYGTLQNIVARFEEAVTDTTNPVDYFIDTVQALKSGYRKDAVWTMNGLTVGTVRKYKNKEGDYIWQPSLQAGQPSLLLGYPVEENEDMPDIGVNANPVAFGNFKRGYWIVDRVGIRSLRDPYTNKPFVHFYTTKRVGGMLMDSQAIKLMVCGS
jgi:HK97 family phage major capsid protein